MTWLEEINEFASFSEFEHFRLYLTEKIAESEIEEIEPQEYYSGKSAYGINKDRWFKDNSSNEIWRLVPPDFPFKGFFKRVIYPLEGYNKHVTD